MKTLVLGGARSGKSRFAETAVLKTGLSPIYIATGQARDHEMRERIARHKTDRAADGWKTIEEPLELARAIAEADQSGNAILVDCLTLWLTNKMMDGSLDDRALSQIAETVTACTAPIFLVSNEVGFGIVPENAMARAFRDQAGRLHQLIADDADNVILVVAGQPLAIKGSLP